MFSLPSFETISRTNSRNHNNIEDKKKQILRLFMKIMIECTANERAYVSIEFQQQHY